MFDLTEFRTFSARLGSDPLQVQGPGGNTSIKREGVMWIKASGTELAMAEEQEIFVAVDVERARAEAHGAGDGTCQAAVMDTGSTLRPSIETTFHAFLDWPVVAHSHSVATLAHVTSQQGRQSANEKLAGLPFVYVPYAKPGLPLTRKISAMAQAETQVILLENHGLICCEETVEKTAALIAEVEKRLKMPVLTSQETAVDAPPPEGFDWSDASWLAHDTTAARRVLSGSYYPDHVVFLGPGLPTRDGEDVAAIFEEGRGVALRKSATPSQRAMLTCLSDVLARVPEDWSMQPIGAKAEAELLDWDAEKYRQALTSRA